MAKLFQNQKIEIEDDEQFPAYLEFVNRTEDSRAVHSKRSVENISLRATRKPAIFRESLNSLLIGDVREDKTWNSGVRIVQVEETPESEESNLDELEESVSALHLSSAKSRLPTKTSRFAHAELSPAIQQLRRNIEDLLEGSISQEELPKLKEASSSRRACMVFSHEILESEPASRNVSLRKSGQNKTASQRTITAKSEYGKLVIIEPQFGVLGWNEMEALNVPFDKQSVMAHQMGYRYELGNRQAKKIDAVDFELVLDSPQIYSDIYKESFYSEKHSHLVGAYNDEVVVITLKHNEKGSLDALLHTTESSQLIHIFLPSKKLWDFTTSQHQSILSALKNYYPNLKKYKFTKSTSTNLNQQVLQLGEQSKMPKHIKFGIVRRTDNQTEEQIFSNAMSSGLEKFLDYLLEKVLLLNFSRYRGGLDTHQATTGVYSYFVEFEGFELMAHVGPMLPKTSESENVARKRHIGNDMVVVVFDEGKTPFNPSTIVSNFCHVFLIVRPVGPNAYQLAVAVKDSCPTFTPFISSPAVYAADDDFREFLLTKIVNGSTAALKAPVFAGMIHRVRSQILSDIRKSFGPK